MTTNLVANLVRRTREVLLDHAAQLAPGERILSPSRARAAGLGVGRAGRVW